MTVDFLNLDENNDWKMRHVTGTVFLLMFQGSRLIALVSVSARQAQFGADLALCVAVPGPKQRWPSRPELVPWKLSKQSGPSCACLSLCVCGLPSCLRSGDVHKHAGVWILRKGL